MFGRKKMYKKGLADAMQTYEAFGRKQEAALEHMREEVRKGNQKLEAALSDLGEDLNGIYDHLTSKEKAALYHLSTPMDIKDLEDEEKRLLLAVLYQLAFDEGDGVTDSQRGYIRSVQKYLEITNPQTEAELSAVGDIDSLETQKAFLQVVLEFLYLQDGDELSDAQEDFLGCFSVNRKQANLIEERVGQLFNAVGDKGIAEKYGYVPEEDSVETAEQKLSEDTNVHAQTSNISEELADEIAKMCFSSTVVCSCFETENYIIAGESNWVSQNPIYLIHKKTDEWFTVRNAAVNDLKDLPDFTSILFARQMDRLFSKYAAVAVNDTIYYIDMPSINSSAGIFAINANTWQKPSKVVNAGVHSISICGEKMAYVKKTNGVISNVCLYDFDSGKQSIIAAGVENAGAVYVVSDGVFFSYDYPYSSSSALSFYSYKEKKVKNLFNIGNNYPIQKIVFADDEKIYAMCWPRYGSSGYRLITCLFPYKTMNAQEPVNLSKLEHLDIMLSYNSGSYDESVLVYPDMLLYVAKDGTLKSLNYLTGETTELALNAISTENGRHPAHLMRVGKWVYFEGDSRDYVNKVSLDAPGEIEIIERYGLDEGCEREKKIPVLNIKQ